MTPQANLVRLKAAYKAWNDSKGMSQSTWLDLMAHDVTIRSMTGPEPGLAFAAARGIPLMPSTTPIQPVPVPGAARCAAASDALRARGFWVAAIRSPTVPAGTERLRVTLTAAHLDEDIDALADALHSVLRELPAERAANMEPQA